ncbi:MAG: ATP-dependent helicase [Spirochaetes bacterium]|nr:ATP-dependent helicase [Spirochaetota bacterium]
MRQLNREQTEAAKPEYGITLVIAGAGTGKTSTMITKIKNVISNSLANPEQILILTFSRKAAEEIRERLISELGKDAEPGFAGTFHSFSLKLLMENREYYFKHIGIKQFPTVMEDGRKGIIIRDIVMERCEKFLGLPASTVIKLSENINYLDKNTLNKLKSSSLFDEIINLKKIYNTYKRDNSFIEFEDMIEHSIELLQNYGSLRKKITEKYKYLFVDEFQDTSENNFQLLSLLLPEDDKNLFMVGDDYQSIYKFRHSKIEYIINIKKFFPAVKIHKLTMNYRSRKEIVTLANRFIKLNKFRTSKKIVSNKGKGGRVKYYKSVDMSNEADIITQIISSINNNSSIAIIYRNNYQGEFLKNKINSDENKKLEFMTMHGSKGLEFDIVIIAGISDKIIPDRSTDIEEERRLFYVALTRAKEELHLIFYENIPDKLPRFIRELGYKKKYSGD